MKRMLDLFSGLKGASQAFIDDPEWEVVTVDNTAELEPDLVMDLEDPMPLLMMFPPGHFDLIWASPPCVEFYQVCAPWFDNYGEEPSMVLVRSAMTIIQELRPADWVIENTTMGIRFITPVLGDWRQRCGPFFLWGNFPFIDAEVARNHKAANDVWSTNPLRSNIKAKIPYEVSESLKNAVQNQSKLPI